MWWILVIIIFILIFFFKPKDSNINSADQYTLVVSPERVYLRPIEQYIVLNKNSEYNSYYIYKGQYEDDINLFRIPEEKSKWHKVEIKNYGSLVSFVNHAKKVVDANSREYAAELLEELSRHIFMMYRLRFIGEQVIKLENNEVVYISKEPEKEEVKEILNPLNTENILKVDITQYVLLMLLLQKLNDVSIGFEISKEWKNYANTKRIKQLTK